MKRTLLCLILLLVSTRAAYAKSSDKLSSYMYADTKQLVTLVEDAASLIEQKGEAAFNDFSIKDSRWLNDKYYIFVYDTSGKCVFHPIEPALVGQNLMQFKDMNARPAIELILEVGKKPQPDASGWAFYLWEEESHATVPSWKSSYIRKVTAPDGIVYLVGSGLYDMKIEKIFIQNCVDAAVELVLTKGKDAAFADLRSYSSPLNILGSYVVVIDANGDVVVDPSFPGFVKKRNMMDFCDKAGKYAIRDAIEALKKTDRIWLLYIWTKGNSSQIERRLLYIRKINAGNEVFYIYSDYAPATPVWMKQ